MSQVASNKDQQMSPPHGTCLLANNCQVTYLVQWNQSISIVHLFLPKMKFTHISWKLWCNSITISSHWNQIIRSYIVDDSCSITSLLNVENLPTKQRRWFKERVISCELSCLIENPTNTLSHTKAKAKQQTMTVRNATSPFLQTCKFLVLLRRSKSFRLVEPELQLSRPGWEQPT